MNLSWSQVWRGAGAVALLGGWAVLAHLGSAGSGHPDLNVLVALLPIGVALAVLLWQARRPALLAGGLAAAVLAAWAFWPQLRQSVSLLYYLQHLGTHLVLAVLFGRSLFGGGDALVTSMARFIYGNALSARKQRYTRQVTLLWTVFFVLNALVSTGLFLWAPAAVWSVHANLLTGPLIGLVFLCEYMVRLRVLPAHERPSVAEVLQAYRHRMSGTDSNPVSGPSA